jgi:septum site-determining protein MinC
LQTVELKPWRNGLLQELLLTLPLEATWAEALAQAEARLDEAKSTLSWRGAQLTLDLARFSVPLTELEAFVTRLRVHYGLLTVAVITNDSVTIEAARKLALCVYSMPPGSALEKDAQALSAGSNALYIGQTLRSGQRIVHDGHVVIQGDVNAGAEVVAEGDILIFGTLRGLAHAGSRGNEEARIIARNMRPQQLRIASKIARAPEEPGTAAPRPEVARIVNGEIEVFPV